MRSHSLQLSFIVNTGEVHTTAMYKIVIASLALMAVVTARPQESHQSQNYEHKHHEPEYHHHEEHYESVPIKYKFKYEVHDPHTHDFHSQEEEGDGKYVKGYYKLQEPHGGERSVHYEDEGHGFVAHVKTAHITHPHHEHKH